MNFPCIEFLKINYHISQKITDSYWFVIIFFLLFKESLNISNYTIFYYFILYLQFKRITFVFDYIFFFRLFLFLIYLVSFHFHSFDISLEYHPQFFLGLRIQFINQSYQPYQVFFVSVLFYMISFSSNLSITSIHMVIGLKYFSNSEGLFFPFGTVLHVLFNCFYNFDVSLMRHNFGESFIHPYIL